MPAPSEPHNVVEMRPSGPPLPAGIRPANRQWIAETMCPVVSVPYEVDTYAVWSRSQIARDEAEEIALGDPPPAVGMAVDLSNTYTAKAYGVRAPVPQRVASNSDLPILEIMRRQVRELGLLNREIRTAALIETASNWEGTELVGVQQWSDYDNSTPLADLQTGIDSVEDGCGQYPTVIQFGLAVWRKLRWHPDLVDVFKSHLRPPEALAQFLDLDMIVIGRAQFTGSPEGTAEGSVVYEAVWGKKAWIGYLAQNAPGKTHDRSDLRPSAAFAFKIGGELQERTYTMDHTMNTEVSAIEVSAEVATCKGAGYSIQAAVA